MKDGFNVKSINLQYGDATFRFYKIKSVAGIDEYSGNTFHYHQYYECHIVTSGEKTYMIGKNIYVRQNQLLLLPPGLAHFSADSDNTFERCVIEFSLEKNESAEKGFYRHFKAVLDGLEQKPVNISQKLINAANRFNNTEYRPAVEVYCELVSAAADIVNFMFNYKESEDSDNAVIDNFNNVNDIRILLEVMVNTYNMRIEQIAAQLGYSVRHTVRLIKSVYGTSLSEVRARLKLEEAKKLLVSDCSIEDVSYQSGFPSAAAFRSTFKKYEKMTPREYKRRNSDKKAVL